MRKIFEQEDAEEIEMGSTILRLLGYLLCSQIRSELTAEGKFQ